MQCTNPNCQNHHSPSGKFYRKVGHYWTKWNRQPVPRYQCKACGKTFSSHSFRQTYRQKRPNLNQMLFNLACEGVTLRGAARVLGCAKKTVERKFEFVAIQSRLKHLEAVRNLEFHTDQVSMDEMETYEKTKLKPLSIALAVTEGGRIVETQVAEMKCKGHLASISVEKYGFRVDERKEACRKVLQQVANILASTVPVYTIKTDKKTAYISLIHEELPGVRHERFIRKMKVLWGNQVQNTRDFPYGLHDNGRPFDPMFMLNQRCAKIRSQMSRMRRRFWGATKCRYRLAMHLWIFTAWQNKYDQNLDYC